MKLLELLNEETRIHRVSYKNASGVSKSNSINKKFNSKLNKIFTQTFLKKVYRHMPNKIKLNKSSDHNTTIGHVYSKFNAADFKMFKKLGMSKEHVKAGKKVTNTDTTHIEKINRIFMDPKSPSFNTLIHEFVHLIEKKPQIFPEIGQLKLELTRKTNMFKKTKNTKNKDFAKETKFIEELFPILVDGEYSPYLNLLNKDLKEKDIQNILSIVKKYKIFNDSYVTNTILKIFMKTKTWDKEDFKKH